MAKRHFLVWALALLLLPAAALAQVTGHVAHQGLLLDASGLPVPGPVALLLRVWNHPTSTTPTALLYEETHASVPVIDGVYVVPLGGGSAALGGFSPGLFQAGRFLEVAVNGQVQTPRLPVLAVAYSLAAEQAATAATAGNVNRLGGVLASGYQRAVTGTCPVQSAIRSIAADGTVVCEADDVATGDISAVGSGAGLSGGSSFGDATLALADSGVTTAKLADNAVGSAAVAADSLTQADLAPGAAGADEIGFFTVAASDVANATVTHFEVATDAVFGPRIADGSLSGADIAGNTITATKLSNEAGVEFAGGALTVSLPASETTVRSVVVTAPSAGRVRVDASLKLFHPGPAMGPTWVQCGLSTGTTLDTAARGRAYANPHGYITMHRMFTVPSGSTTFRLICIGGAGVSTSSSQLTAAFYSTGY